MNLNLNLNPLLPDGWEMYGPWNEQSGIVTVNSGAGLATTAQQVIVSRHIPVGNKVYLGALYVRILDEAAFDQLRFSLKRNGAKQIPWDAVTGEQFKEDRSYLIDEVFDPGLLEITATNISGSASESGASPDQLNIRVVARWVGYLLRPRRGLGYRRNSA